MISEEKASGKQNTGKYAASKNASIQGNGKVIFDMGNVNGSNGGFCWSCIRYYCEWCEISKQKRAAVIFGLKVLKIFLSGNVSLNEKKDVSGLKNRMAVRLETSNQITSDFSGKWYKKTIL